MKGKVVAPGVLALALSAWSVNACLISGAVTCPPESGGQGFGGILVTVVGGDPSWFAYTDTSGGYAIEMPTAGPGTYTVCIAPDTLPVGIDKVVDPAVGVCKDVTIPADTLFAVADFIVDGPACQPAQPGPCWLTGGGTIDKVKGKPHYSFGGVVYPGCSPRAAGGGNWNVVDHVKNLHFKGLYITVDKCSGVPTRSPKVNVNVINFHGTGIVKGVADNPFPMRAVNFVGQATDWNEPGRDKDLLFLVVTDAVTSEVLMAIARGDDPAPITTGNLQIHTSGCNKYQ